MVLTELLLKIPYRFAWRLSNASNYSFPIVFYCTEYVDYLVFAPIRKHLPELTIVAKNKKVQEILSKKGISSILYPAYPKVVIMARHALHMFPSKKIIKIGMRHGAYNFKKFINAKKYNRFDLFLFTSENEVKSAIDFEINIGVAVGFPKIDELHDNSITNQKILMLKNNLRFDPNKKTILFSATWNKSGISAIEKWYNKLDEFTDKFNVLVTVHPFTEQRIISTIENNSNIYFIKNENINAYLVIADLLVSDTSSIIGEYCTLNKPIITFRIEERGRLNPEIIAMLDEISFRIDDFNELKNMVTKALNDSYKHSEKRIYYSSRMFKNLNGTAGKEAAKVIEEHITSSGITF